MCEKDFTIAELTTALENLVAGLQKTNWSSWQTTEYFWDELESARAVLLAIKKREGTR